MTFAVERDRRGLFAAVPPSVRFDQMVDRSGGPEACWPFLGCTNHGYGVFTVRGRQLMKAHRYAFVHYGAQALADGVHLDHLCHDESCEPPCLHRRCCNPTHLRPTTAAQNNAPGRRRTKALRSHCPAGHEFTEGNTRIWRGSRYCRRCQADRRAATRVLKGRRPDFETVCQHGHAWSAHGFVDSSGARRCRECRNGERRRRRVSARDVTGDRVARSRA